ncbi:MAG: photosynthetic complex assembly protein PuhC [Beijerinckiaceae bacterium]
MTTMFAQNPLGRMAPVIALVAAGAVIAATALMRDQGATTVTSPVTESRMLRFEDAPGGVVNVETVDGVIVASFGSGEGSFVRGVLRSFARDRRGSHLSTQAPFELMRYADGRVSLRDTVTGQVVVLDAFGSTNAALFASFLREGK